VANLTGTIAALGLTFGLLFKLQHWPGAGVLLIVSLILLFAVFIPLYTYNRFSKSVYVDNRFIFIIFAVSMIAILTTMISIKVSEDVLKDYEASFITVQETNQRYEQMEREKQLSPEIMDQAAVVFSLTQSIRNDLITMSQPNHQISETGIIQMKNLRERIAQNVVNNYFSRGLQENKGYMLYDALIELNRLSNPDFSLEYKQGIMALKEENANLWLDQYFREMPLIVVLTELEQIELALNIAIHH
jgi:hypothetical protein